MRNNDHICEQFKPLTSVNMLQSTKSCWLCWRYIVIDSSITGTLTGEERIKPFHSNKYITANKRMSLTNPYVMSSGQYRTLKFSSVHWLVIEICYRDTYIIHKLWKGYINENVNVNKCIRLYLCMKTWYSERLHSLVIKKTSTVSLLTHISGETHTKMHTFLLCHKTTYQVYLCWLCDNFSIFSSSSYPYIWWTSCFDVWDRRSI